MKESIQSHVVDKLTTMDTKLGCTYSPAFGIKPTTSVELLEQNGYSLDLGAVGNTDFLTLGLSKDINSLVDVGAGVTSNLKDKVSGYLGISVKF